MAIQFDGTTDYLYRTSSLIGYNGLYTMMCWVLIDQTSGSPGTVLSTSDGTVDNYDLLYIGATNKPTVEATVGTTWLGDSGSGPAALSADTWYHLCMRRNDGSSLDLIYDGVKSGATVSGDVSSRAAQGREELAILASNFAFSTKLGVIVAYKAWSGAALTDAQIDYERRFYVPCTNFGSLHAWTPLFTTSLLEDHSGNGRIWTSNGTPVTFTGNSTGPEGPPILWSPSKRRRLYFIVSSGTIVNPGAAQGTATVPGVTGGLIALPSAASASSVAPAPTGGIQANPATAAASAAGLQPSIGIAIGAASAAASGLDPLASIKALSDAAAAIAAGNQPLIGIAIPCAAASAVAPSAQGGLIGIPAAATASATVPTPTGVVTALPGAAAASAVAPNPTTTPGGDQTTATPGAGQSSATVPAPLVTIVVKPSASVAQAVGSDPNAILIAIPVAASASATGNNPTGRLTATTTVAVSVAGMPAPSVGVSVPATASAASATANAPLGVLIAIAGAAAGSGVSNDPTTIPSPFVFVEGVKDEWIAKRLDRDWKARPSQRTWSARET